MNDRSFIRLLAAGTIATTVTIASGGLVSALGAGAACSSWPICVESLAMPAAGLAMGHRALVLIALLLVLAGAAGAWRRRDRDGWVRLPPLIAPILLLAQVGVGALMVQLQRHDLADVSHLALALLTLACQLVALVALMQPAALTEGRLGASAERSARRLRGLAWWSAAAAGVLVLALSRRGQLGDSLSLASGLPANAAGALTMALTLSGGTLWQTWRLRKGDMVLIGAGALSLALVGATGALLWLPTQIIGLGIGLGASLWIMALTVAMLTMRRPLVSAPAGIARPLAAAEGRQLKAVIDDYISLTKPKVISLLLVTTLAAMFITEAGTPSLWLVIWTMIGGYLAAGGAGAINCAFDSDIDINMGRTSRRPVPSGRISRRSAMAFGLVLSALSVIVMLAFTTPMATFWSTLGIVYYAYFYTQLLKRSTWQNIIIGGGAGAIPPLVGWTAVTGTVSLAAVLLFVIIFYWTPPHFWALALVKQKDYARAGVPMLPVVAGEAETRWQIWVYSVMLVGLSLLLTPIQAMGWIYLVLALILGGLFLHSAWGVWRRGDQAAIWGLYKYSLLYLALLFAAMVVDRLILG